MLRLLGIVIAIGLADSLNPTTVAPAMFMATGSNPRRSVAQFTAAVFCVYFAGGLLIALGPGAVVLALVPKPDHLTTQVIEVVAGVILIVVGVLLWRYRFPLSDKRLPEFTGDGRASWVLGASITAVELPTAFPYFGALAAIVGSGEGFDRQLLALLIFNVCFIAPLLAILATLRLAGHHAVAYLTRAREFLQRHWPVLLASVALVAGLITIGLGATGTVKVVKRSLAHGIGNTVEHTIRGTIHSIAKIG